MKYVEITWKDLHSVSSFGTGPYGGVVESLRVSGPVQPASAVGSQSAETRAARGLVPALVAAIFVALGALVVAALYSAAFAPQLLADPGPLVRWGVGTATLLTELSLSVTIGALMLAVFVVPNAGQGRRGARAKKKVKTAPGITFRGTMAVAAIGSIAWTLTAVAKLVFAGANTIGTPITDPFFGEQWTTYLLTIPSGRALLSIALTAAVISLLCLLVSGPIGAMITLVIAAYPLVMMSLMGHAAGAANHELAVSGMFLHLVGAAVWIGALVTIAILRAVNKVSAGELATTVARYSTIAGWCFALVAVSGVVNTVVRVGGLDGLTTKYGILALVKVALFLILGLFGWLHRRHVISSLELTAKKATARIPAIFWRLVAVELLVMGAVSGVAVALGGTAPPVEETPFNPSPAFQLTGADLPPAPTWTNWLTLWRWDVLFAFLTVAGLITYWRWALRLRKRGDSWSWLRTANWTIAMVLMFWVTNGGPAVYGKVLFSSHMIMHMVLAMVIPIFLVSAAPVTLLTRAIPARKDNSRGPREWLLGLIHSPYGRFISHPIVAAVNFAGSMILFYFSPLFELAMTTHMGHILMIVHFTLVGYFFANALIGIDPGPSRPGYAQRLILLLATMAFHAFFGVAIMSMDVLLAPDWFGLMGRDWGKSAILDQQEGGGIAWGIGEIPTVSLAIIVAVIWSRTDERAASRRDRQVDEYGDQELDEYNAMLTKLAEDDAKSAQ